MINDLVGIISERFKELKNIRVIVDGRTIDIIGESKRYYNWYICDIHFKSDNIVITNEKASGFVFNIGYDDFTNVDEFIGLVLSKRFYYDQ